MNAFFTLTDSAARQVFAGLLILLFQGSAYAAEGPCRRPPLAQAPFGLVLTEATLACARAAGFDPWAQTLRWVGEREKLGPGWTRGNAHWERAYQDLVSEDKAGAKEKAIAVAGVLTAPGALLAPGPTDKDKETLRAKPAPRFLAMTDESLAVGLGSPLALLVDPTNDAGKRFFAQLKYLASLNSQHVRRAVMDKEYKAAERMEAEVSGDAVKIYGDAEIAANQRLLEAGGNVVPGLSAVVKACESRLFEHARAFKAQR